MTPQLSVWLDLCRVIAAFAVYIGHSVAHRLAPAELSLTWHRSADDAVVAFFVISGFVIAYTTERQQRGPKHYLLARASRIYSVVLPVTLAVLAIDHLGMNFNLQAYAADWQYPRLWLFLPFHWLFLGETWLGSIQPFTMEPYWSLVYEVWYYLFFAVVAFTRGPWRWLLALLALGIMGPGMLLLMPMWWLGVYLSRRVPSLQLDRRIARAMMLASVGLYGGLILSGWRASADGASRALYRAIDQGVSAWLPFGFDPGPMVFVFGSYVVAGLFAVFVVGCAHADLGFGERTSRLIRQLAGYTFTLYLVHNSLLIFFNAVGWTWSGWSGFAARTAIVLTVTWLLGQIGEQRLGWYRRQFTRGWDALARRRSSHPA